MGLAADAATVPADLEGKQQHVVEVAKFVDAGPSIWLKGVTHSDFHAATLLETGAQFFQEDGLPAQLTFDNDPCFVGSARGRDFPSALVRFLLCLGVEPCVCPPHRPAKNAYVERFQRTLGHEWLLVHRPSNCRAGARGHRALCLARHSRASEPAHAPVAIDHLASPAQCLRHCPASPSTLMQIGGCCCAETQAFARKVQAGGSVTRNQEHYDVKQKVGGKPVMLLESAGRQAV
jgi:hypothetical protein